jgi:transketolase
MRDAFLRVLTGLAPSHPELVLLSGDLGFGVLDEFRARFPRQFVNAGVAEQNMTGLAAGLALEGRTVFTYSIGNFPTLRCLEQIRNDVCYHAANVKIVAVGGGLSYGPVGMSHHATEDLAALRALPGLALYAPGDVWEAAEITRHLLVTSGPAYLRLDKSAARVTHQVDDTLIPGAIRTVRAGNDVTLAASGGILGEALAAADRLAAEGIRARVLSVHTVKPLERATLARAARETGGIVTVEEHNVDGGVGGAIAEALLEEGAAPRWFWRIGLRDTFSDAVGSQAYLREVYGLGATAIAAAVAARWKRAAFSAA